MPAHLVKRINLDKMHPRFLAVLLDLLAKCESQQYLYVAICGYRAKSEQAKLYFQGRTTPGRIVTNAKPGLSFHQYGVACDLVRDLDVLKDGLQPAWDSPRYLKLKEEGEKLGLQVGVKSVPGGDPGHVQIPDQPGLIGRLNAAPDLKAAWAIVDEVWK